jgi:hypothetical protein
MTLWLTKRWNRFGTVFSNRNDWYQDPPVTGMVTGKQRHKPAPNKNWQLPKIWDFEIVCSKTFLHAILELAVIGTQRPFGAVHVWSIHQRVQMRALPGRAVYPSVQAEQRECTNENGWKKSSSSKLDYSTQRPILDPGICLWPVGSGQKRSPKQSLPFGKLTVCYGRHDPFTDELPIQLLFSIAVF